MCPPSDRDARSLGHFLRRSPFARALCAAVIGPTLLAQQPADELSASNPDAAIEDYLADHGLDDLLAAQLQRRLTESVGPDRVTIAERLGRMYVDRLSKATSPDARQELERASRDLFKLVPEADSFELRIDLAKVGYLRAENMAERERLKLATAEERSEAERLLRAVAPVFHEIAAKVGRKAEALERKDQSGRDEEGLKEQLADARRLRSLAMYYTGWTNYYLAFLTGSSGQAIRALEDFGYLLNAVQGRPASVDRLPVGLLKYEHVARAAVGCALCSAMKPGGDTEALRWLEAIAGAEGLPETVAAELFRHHAVVLASAKRWADLDLYVKRRLRPPRDGAAKPLSPVEARLLAVLTLGSINPADPASRSGDLVAALAQVALSELVTQGRAGDVLDLVQQFGTAPIGQSGFIVQFVRGLQAYERARTEHKALGNADDPAPDPSVVNRYREAAKVMLLAVESTEGSKYPAEQSHASMMLARALYYAGEFKAASDQFLRTAEGTKDAKLREDATWQAIVALDRATDAGDRSLIPDRDKLATIFLNSFARSPNASVLLLRRAGAGLLSDEATIQILSDVPPDSPLHSVARRQVSEILFKSYRKAPAADRAARARAFLDAADQAIKLSFRDATAPGASTESAQAALRSARQIAEVALSLVPPDAALAESALDAIDQLGVFVKLDISGIEDELTYRRLQVAVERGRTDLSDPLAAKLRSRGGPFALAADRLMLASAIIAWRAQPGSEPLASAVLRSGSRVADVILAKPDAGAEVNNFALFNDVAEAARVVWRSNKNPTARDLALKLDRLVIASKSPPAAALRRFADLSEEAGESNAALDAWRTLLNGLDPAKPEWFEARFHSARLLATSDPEAARNVLVQHRLLNPEMGPQPWGTKLAELETTLGTPAPPSRSPAGPAAGGGW